MHSEELTKKFQEMLGEGGCAIEGGRETFMEIVEEATGNIWMSLKPVSQSDFDNLLAPEGFQKTGTGAAVMDAAGFIHTPNRPGEPAEVMEVDGRKFCSNSMIVDMHPSDIEGAPVKVIVNKAHVLGFEAGREIAVMEMPEGDFIEVIGCSSDDEKLVLPEGAKLRREKLTKPLVLTLPTPTQTYFWVNPGNPRSFQGPVDLSA